jgi:predicted ATPase
MGEFVPAREHLEMGISLYDPERPLAFGLNLPGVVCLVVVAWTLWQLGYPDQALKRGNEALELAQRLSHPYSVALAEGCLGFLHQFRGEARAVQEHSASLTALSAEHGFTELSAFASTPRGWAISQQGRNEEAITQIQEGLATSHTTGAEVYRPYFLTLLVEACLEMGRLDDGLNALTEALALADEHEARAFEAEMHRLKGELLLKQDPPKVTEAQACFREAIDFARKHSGKSFELRATTRLARRLASQDRRDEALATLAEIYNWFTEGFDTADLTEAEALLDELSA